MVGLYSYSLEPYFPRFPITSLNAADSLFDQEVAIEDLDTFLDKQQFKRSHQPFDPNNLPFSTPNAKDTRKPITDEKELKKMLGQETDETTAFNDLMNSLIPEAQAAHGDEPTPGDLAETIDVQLTEAIQQKANELNNSPVAIYNWVRNNIEFIPTYGSIQGADMTLQTLRGNAFDTSSLLIALLRASDIPARYVYGTVSIPTEQVMNWVGGVEVPEAAMQLLGQGGIPNTGLIQGGIVKFIRMEHIWVESWVDFVPSRGAINKVADNWVPMDAAFKQYEYADGLDILSDVPFDADTFAQTIIDNAIIDETAGTVQGIDQQFIESQLTQYQQQVEDFINTQHPDATVGEVIGKKIIQEQQNPVLASGLPYTLVATSNRFSAISDNLRHKYRFTLQNQYGNEIFTQTLDLPSIAGRTLALSFKPKTATDEQTLLSFIPEDATDISDLPTSLPGYLINMEGEFNIEGEAIITGGTFQLGEEARTQQSLYNPWRGWRSTNNIIVAGEYHAIAVNGVYVSEKQLDVVEQDLESTRIKLEEFINNGTIPDGETKHDLTGKTLQAGILSYFAVNDTQDELAASILNTVSYRLPSYGVFSNNIKTTYAFGLIPKSIKYTGVLMDIDLLALTVTAKNNSIEERINFVKNIGNRLSTYEHIIPEQLFNNDEGTLQAISAVKALFLAAQEGQKIYTFTNSNINEINQLNIDGNVKAEIINAINSGKQSTVSERAITLNGWSGVGYIIIDPETGSGAYKISGGANGGAMTNDPDEANDIDWFGILGILDAITPLFDNKFVKLFGSILGKLINIINAIEAADSCTLGDGIILYISYFITGLAYIALALAFPLIISLVLLMLGLFMFTNLWIIDINICKARNPK